MADFCYSLLSDLIYFGTDLVMNDLEIPIQTN